MTTPCCTSDRGKCPCGTLFLASFLIPFAALMATLYPSIGPGDSGELVTEACNFGVAHAPGYPLFVLLGGLWCKFVPLGEPAFRMNVMSAVFASLSSALLFNVIAMLHRIVFGVDGGDDAGKKKKNDDAKESKESSVVPVGVRDVTAASVAVLFTLNPLTWEHATSAEVFSLNHLLIGVFLSAFVAQFKEGGSCCFDPIRVMGVVAGLCMCNQHTSVLIVAPLLAYSVLTAKKNKIVAIFDAMTGALAGLTPYIFVVAAGSSFNEFSWGDASTFEGLFNLVIRADYGTFSLQSVFKSGESSFIELTVAYVISFLKTTAFVGAPLLALGAVKVLSGKSYGKSLFATLFLSSFVGQITIFHGLSNAPIGNELWFNIHSRFWMQFNFIAFIFIAVGFIAAFEIAWTSSPAGSRATVATGFKALACAAVIAAFAIGYTGSMNRRADTHVVDHARAVLDSVPEGSFVLLSGDDHVNGVRYLQMLGERPDIHAIPSPMTTYPWWSKYRKNYPGVIFPGGHRAMAEFHPARAAAYNEIEFILKNADKFPIALCFENESMEHIAGIPTPRIGLCRLDGRRNMDKVANIEEIFEKAEETFLKAAMSGTPTTWAKTTMATYAHALRESASAIIYVAGQKRQALRDAEEDPSKAEGILLDQEEVRRAIKLLEASNKIYSDVGKTLSPQQLKHMGAMFLNLEEPTDEDTKSMGKYFSDYLETDEGTNDPSAGDIFQIVASAEVEEDFEDDYYD